MPIFTKQLRQSDMADPQAALRAMYSHIRYIQEQLEYTLTNLDSSNVTEIETDVTNITSSTGEVSFSGNHLSLSGKNGEVFEAGVNSAGAFQFKVNGKNGAQMLYLNPAGELVISSRATISIDCGTWD